MISYLANQNILGPIYIFFDWVKMLLGFSLLDLFKLLIGWVASSVRGVVLFLLFFCVRILLPLFCVCVYILYFYVLCTLNKITFTYKGPKAQKYT